MKKIALHYQILIGMTLGLLWGYAFPAQVPWVTPLGTVFLRLLKMIVIPLIFVSIVDGIANVANAKRLSEMGFKTVVYYLATNALAVIVSMVLVQSIQPGRGVSLFGAANPEMPAASFTFYDLIPANLFAPFVEGNSIQIIFLAILLGVGLVMLKDKARGLIEGFGQANELLLRLTGWIIRLAPVGVFGLLAGLTQAIDWSSLIGIGKFALTIMAALAIHGCLTLPFIFKTFSSRPLKKYLKSMEPALLTAFSTSSSSATLPVTLECVEKDAGVPKEVAGFVLPVGATVNMDGTAMYEAVACFFIAQALGIELTLTQQLIVFLTASLAAIGAAAIPSAGLVTLTLVLNAVGLPLEGIGLLLAIDRPLDMSRTAVNVWGDMVGCAVIEGKTKKGGLK